MKQLLVLRHAKSSWKDARLSDFERPLNNRGKRDAPKMGKLIAKMDLTPELIISSAAKRALMTAEAAAANCGYEGNISATRDLYMGTSDDYLAILRDVPDSVKTVMVVGHNPDVEDLIEELTGSWEAMPTAALAQIQLPIDAWQALDLSETAELVNLWRPKELN
jgi:phosphohistidine phosphatase